MSSPIFGSVQGSASTPTPSSLPLPLLDDDAHSNDTLLIEPGNVEEEENVEEQGDIPYTTKKRKRTSKVWDDFKEVIDLKGVLKAKCIHCKSLLTINKSGSTSHFGRHISNCTAKKINNAKGQQNISVSMSLNQTEAVASVSNFKYEQSKIREVLSHMIIVHELPFRFSEYELFNLLMTTATPHYQKISRATAMKDCLASYELEKKKLMNEMKYANRVSMTTDLWKSDQNISYMVVTGHFVDSNWNLQKRILNFCNTPPPHTGVVISDVLQRCFREWGIEEKVWTITVDNASNNDVAVRTLRENLLFQHTLPLGGTIFHVRCCAHILNLLVQDGLSAIQDVIYKVRESVKYILASEARVLMFGEIAKQLQLSSKKLVLDCCTRWNATYFMLSCALEFKAVFPRYQQRDPAYTTLPSEEEWQKVGLVCTFLEDFHQITELISGSEYPIANLFLVELIHIKSILTPENVDQEQGTCTTASFMNEMIRKMKLKFDQYWGSYNLLISMAAVLDPRNKMKYIEWCAENCYSEADGILFKTTVFQTLRNLYGEYVEDYRASITDGARCMTDAQSECSSGVSGVSSMKSSVSRSSLKYDSFRKTVTSVEQMKSDFDLYFEEVVEECADPKKFDAIDWWKRHRLKYKILSKMACDVLSIPITTVASESAFSAGGRVIDPQRASLGVDTVQMLLCAEDWLRARYEIKRKAKDKEDNIKEVTFS